jgi:hypothetical protein
MGSPVRICPPRERLGWPNLNAIRTFPSRARLAFAGQPLCDGRFEAGECLANSPPPPNYANS